jgi:hypothetical protein
MTKTTDQLTTTATNPLSVMSLDELAGIERTYGVRLSLPASVRRRLDAHYSQPVQLTFEAGR